jgi:putative molybdopterin biosynthesis protein
VEDEEMAEGLLDSSELTLAEMSPEEALERFLSELEFQDLSGRAESEDISVLDCLGRITSQAIAARLNSPHYYAAAQDGLAVRASDTLGSSQEQPVDIRPLRLPDGLEGAPINLKGLWGAFVETGSPLPSGTDAVIPVGELAWAGGDLLRIQQPSNPFRHVRPIGEEIAEHEIVVPKDHRIQAVDIGAMTAAGTDLVKVYRRPRVAIVPLGKNLVPPGTLPEVGQMLDSNSPTLAGLVSESGGVAHVLPLQPEDLTVASATLMEAVENADIIFVLAGPSHGSPFVSRLIGDNGERVVHGIAMKPCQTTVLGIVSGKPVIGFPFDAMGVFAAYELFARALMAEKLGPSVSLDSSNFAEATLSVPLKRKPGLEEMVRVKMGRVDGVRVAVPDFGGASTLMSLVRASGYIRVRCETEELKPGHRVQVRLLSTDRRLEGNILLLGTHDISYDLLRSQLLGKFPELSLHTAATGGMKGLNAVRNGLCHVAAIHLFDEETGDYNVPFLKDFAEPMVLINLLSRDLGLIVAPGNPKEIKGLRDLERPEVRFVNRQKGSGTRVLLDYYLRKRGVDASKIDNYENGIKTHMAAAAAVASQNYDAAPGISTAARTLGLTFIPCIPERLDLAIPKRFLNRFPVSGLLEVIRSQRFRKEAEIQFSDYDFSQTGEVIWASE